MRRFRNRKADTRLSPRSARRAYEDARSHPRSALNSDGAASAVWRSRPPSSFISDSTGTLRDANRDRRRASARMGTSNMKTPAHINHRTMRASRRTLLAPGSKWCLR